MSEFDKLGNLLTTNPFLYARVFLKIHRAILFRFPYSIYYSVDEVKREVEVLAVLHQKRDPEIIRKRLKL